MRNTHDRGGRSIIDHHSLVVLVEAVEMEFVFLIVPIHGARQFSSGNQTSRVRPFCVEVSPIEFPSFPSYPRGDRDSPILKLLIGERGEKAQGEEKSPLVFLNDRY